MTNSRSALSVNPEKPELLAVIRVTGGRRDGTEVVVVKRGGEPQHVSEIIPEVLDRAGVSAAVGRWLPNEPGTPGEVATPATPADPSPIEAPAA